MTQYWKRKSQFYVSPFTDVCATTFEINDISHLLVLRIFSFVLPFFAILQTTTYIFNNYLVLPNNRQTGERYWKRARSINKPMHFFLLALNTPPIRDICSASDANKSGERFAPASVPLARARSSCCSGACLRLSSIRCAPYGNITIMSDVDVTVRCTTCSGL